MNLLCNEYTHIIPNTTQEIHEQFNVLHNTWKMIYDNKSKNVYVNEQMRESNWIPPKEYTFSRFIDNGLRLEVLQSKEIHTDRIILMVHGGSFIYRMHDCFIIPMPLYADAGHQATVVSVDYRVPPEANYMDMIQDVVRTYEWILDKGYSPSDIVFAGDSSAGGTVLSSLLYMRDHKYIMPAGVITLSAATNINFNTTSWMTNKDVDLLTHNSCILDKVKKCFLQDNDPYNPYISPYYGDFQYFPPMLLQVGGSEGFLDDSKDIADRAFKQHVDVTLEIYENMFHDFQCMKGSLAEAEIAWANIEKFMNRIYQS